MRLTIVLILCFCSVAVFGQNIAINNSGNVAHPSAMLDVNSSTRGLLIPRMTSAERAAIVSPALGLMVFDTDTRTFWFYNNTTWTEMYGGGGQTGAASGDLSGNYPSPNVVKLQNLDVAFGVPFDKQVLKWNTISNQWQGMNDSLFLPYDVTFGSPTKLFGITNSNTTAGSSAIFGRNSNAGSGINPAFTMGVWGDNNTGAGIVGTSNTGVGSYGFSFQNHAMYGFSAGSSFAGVYGTNSAPNGTGVKGEISLMGYAIHGKATGNSGTAGFFEITNSSNTAPGLHLNYAGIASGAFFNYTNSTSPNPAISVDHAGKGHGVQVNLSNSDVSNVANAVTAVTQGWGAGIYGKSSWGNAGKFEITNEFNLTEALSVVQAGTGVGVHVDINNSNNNNAMFLGNSDGKGYGMYLNLANPLANKEGIYLVNNGTAQGMHLVQVSPANNATGMYVSTQGTGSAGHFWNNNGTNSNPALKIEHAGTGRGIQSTLQNAGSNAAAIYGSSSGALGIHGLGQEFGIKGQSTGLTGGIGVLGISSLNSGTGIGVKGESYSTSQTLGSITGINHSSGIAVYGENTQGGTAMKAYANGNLGRAIFSLKHGGGENIEAETYGGSLGVGVRGKASVSSGYGAGVIGENETYGDGVKGFGGAGGAGVAGVSDENTNSSRAGLFEVNNTSNAIEAFRINNAGLGSGLYVNNTNNAYTGTFLRFKNSGTGDYAVFETALGVNEIRFDNTGKGFFNGGTQTGGADVAEAFDVQDDRNNYEAGDVLVISLVKDRTVTKSAEPYSDDVAGVYATKPGVLMTEEPIDADLSGKVPMGVLGVIPTKVCMEGGKIERGDLLVTSSIPGVAMKADPSKIRPGQVIGKALENFEGTGVLKIRVLVNVK